jgi:uncharacterized membrane protein
MKELFELAAVAVEASAVLLLLMGLVYSAVRFLMRAIRGSGLTAYHSFRQELGRNLLLINEYPCISLTNLMLDYREEGKWPYSVGVY